MLRFYTFQNFVQFCDFFNRFDTFRRISTMIRCEMKIEFNLVDCFSHVIYWITIERVNLQYSRLTTDYCVHTDGKFFSGMVLMYYYGCMNLYLASGSRQCKHGSLRRSVSRIMFLWITITYYLILESFPWSPIQSRLNWHGTKDAHY